MFTRCLPLEVAYRLWDVYVLVGTPFFFQASFGILRILEPMLLKEDMGVIMRLLHSLPPVSTNSIAFFKQTNIDDHH